MRLAASRLAALCAIAETAGREILSIYATDFTHSQKPDSSPLTEADLRADRVIREGLEREFPGTFIWSEESISPDSTSRLSTFFLVDPLDGTREFLQRNGEFTVNIALIDAGEPVAGVVFAPVPNELFFAARGLGAWKLHAGAETRIHTTPSRPTEPLRIIGSRSHGGEGLAAWRQALDRPHDFVAAGSSLKFCRIAEGAADAYPRIGPTCQWDTAAGQAILEEAGGCVVDPAGVPLRYGLERAVLNPNFLALGDPALRCPPVP